MRCFGFGSSILSVMILGKEYFHSDSDKDLAFTMFFASVFVKFVSLSLPVSHVRFLLECCDDSITVGADGIPSFMLCKCTPVFELLNWILKNQQWREFWKPSYVFPVYTYVAHNDIANYRQHLV